MSIYRLIPQEWLEPATLGRVHVHWTAGAHKCSEFDRGHYHVLVEDDGKIVRGLCDLAANSTTHPYGRKANHTLNANTGAAAVSLCCMAEAIERPFKAGKYPLTRKQWDVGAMATAELCFRYNIKVTPRTVLTHAEVQANLGIRQRGKWDIAILPFDMNYDTARECGDLLREQVQEHLIKIQMEGFDG
jgi:hypothetical protein